MAPLPLAAPEAKKSLNDILIAATNFLFPKPRPEPDGKKKEGWKASLLWDLGIPKPKGLEDEDMPETTVTFPPESHRTETDSIWKATGFANSDEYAELMSNPGNDYRKRSLPDQESPLITLTTTAMGTSLQQELGKSRITLSQEISLLIFMWIAAVVICGAIVWVVAKIESKIHRFVESDILEFGEKC
ncbi:hypothetical protein HOY80DRAFT_1002082 [Tuber brumale]|nr:hypothetical protein HOY80DRAFT_1002082 [Tuber brumale]